MPFTIFEHLVVGPLGCNCYIIGDDATDEAIVIDPGGDAAQILEAITKHGLTVRAVVATHAHFDHILAADQVRSATGASFHLHADDVPLLGWMSESMKMFLGIDPGPPPDVDRVVVDSDELIVGAFSLAVLHTPGHSPGSISLLVPDSTIFSGDTLFSGSVGRTDLPGGSHEQELASIRERLFVHGDLDVFPGHGPSTTIGREMMFNPFVGEAAR